MPRDEDEAHGAGSTPGPLEQLVEGAGNRVVEEVCHTQKIVKVNQMFIVFMLSHIYFVLVYCFSPLVRIESVRFHQNLI
jgi:hypothetical protein